MKVVITGANGFIGREVAAYLTTSPKYTVVGTTRSSRGVFTDRPIATINVSDISSTTDWSHALTGADAVVHLAGVSPRRDGKERDITSPVYTVNAEGTLNLARQAAAAGVRRFVFLSSIKVNGEGKPDGSAYTYADSAKPEGIYGWSKHVAEEGLRSIARDTGYRLSFSGRRWFTVKAQPAISALW